MLTREEILGYQDLQTKDVVVPEWGGEKLLVRMLTASERNRLHEAAKVDGQFDITMFQTTLVVMTAVKEDGSAVFEPEDASRLAAKSGAAVARIAQTAQELNGLGAKAVGDVEKN